jgi:drug/metabolite transporter (DMT)-like permease
MTNLVFFWLAVGAVRTKGELLIVGLINYLWPSFTLLLAIPILNKRPTWWLIPGLLAVIGGIFIAVLSTNPGVSVTTLLHEINLTAYLFACIDALAWGLYSNLSRKLSHPEGGSSVPLYMLFTSFILLVWSSFNHLEYSPTIKDWCLLVGWALSSGLAYLFWDIGMRKGNVITISTTSMLIPLLSTVITAVLSGMGLTVEIFVAATLVVAGSTICRRGVR